MQKSINTKLILGQLFMALLGVVALAVCGYIILYTTLMTSQREKAEYVAQSWGRSIEQHFTQQIKKVEEIGTSEEVKIYSQAFWEGALALYFAGESDEHLPIIAYLDSHGLEEAKIIYGKKSTHFFNHGTSPLFRKAKASPNEVFFRIITEANEGDLTPPYIKFMYYAENLGDFSGVVMAMAPLSSLAPELTNFHFEKTGFVCLLNHDGVVLAHPDKNKILQSVDLSVFKNLAKLRQGVTLFKRATILGNDQYNAIVATPKLGILVNASLPRQQFLSVPNKLILIYLAVIFLTLSLCLVVSFLLAKGITKPILNLATVSNQLAQGDWSQEIDTSAEDEIGVLAKSFQVMKQRLHDTIVAQNKEISAREKSEKRYKTLFDSAPDAISILDKDGKIIDVNPACCELYGMDKKTMLNRASLDFIDKQNWPACQMNFAKLQNEHVGIEEEISILYGSKSQRPVWRKARALVEEDGTFRGVLAYDRDISTQKELENLRADLERIARHDLKTPLNGVINLPFLIKREKNLSEKQLKWLQMIEDSGYKMLDLVNKSLDMYRMETGTYKFMPVSVDLIPTLHKISIDLMEEMQTKRLDFQIIVNKMPLTDETSFIIPGDELLCYSMFANLIKNAIEASPVGKSIDISLETEKKHNIVIHNWGTVPDDLKDCFFNKYTTAGKKCGTGLGTYSAMLMAKTQKGDISMNSSAQGTFIKISFPTTI